MELALPEAPYSLPPFLGQPFISDLQKNVKLVAIHDIKPYDRTLRKHSKAQKAAMMGNLEKFGQVMPIPLRSDGVIIDGHLVLDAMRELGATHVLAIYVNHLSDAEIKALRVALNKLSDATVWDDEQLIIELTEIVEAGIDLEIVGSDTIELDVLSENLRTEGPDKDDAVPVLPPDYRPMTRLGDLWVLGDHRLFCGDATNLESYRELLGNDPVQMVFTDPPYNVKINGHVKRNSDAHREFVMASGEMTTSQFVEFLRAHMDCMRKHLQDGAIIYECMDWRHMREMLCAAEGLFEFKNLCVWVKDRAGMGSFYRSQHEMVFVFKHGTAAHINNFSLGARGRFRSNAWFYPAVRLKKENKEAGGIPEHPTLKPVAMVADAIMDCSKAHDIVLDPFAGSGTTLVAAERTHRKARVIELDPIYCDLIIRRWEEISGQKAKFVDGRPVEEIRQECLGSCEDEE